MRPFDPRVWPVVLGLIAVPVLALADEPSPCPTHDDCPPGFDCLCDAWGRLVAATGDSDGDGVPDTITTCTVGLDDITITCRTERDANENGVPETILESSETGGPNHGTIRDYDEDEDGRIERREVDSYSGWGDWHSRYAWTFDDAGRAVGCTIDDYRPGDLNWECVADPPCPPGSPRYVPDPALPLDQAELATDCRWSCREVE